jgi:hypothetical protein
MVAESENDQTSRRGMIHRADKKIFLAAAADHAADLQQFPLRCIGHIPFCHCPLRNKVNQKHYIWLAI